MQLGDKQTVVNVKNALLAPKVLVVGLISLGKMSIIGSLELFLDDWLGKRRLTTSILAKFSILQN